MTRTPRLLPLHIPLRRGERNVMPGSRSSTRHSCRRCWINWRNSCVMSTRVNSSLMCQRVTDVTPTSGLVWRRKSIKASVGICACEKNQPKHGSTALSSGMRMTPLYSRLREVLRAVIDLQKRKKDLGSIDEDVIEYELTRLSAALRILMPARAQKLLVSMVADRIRSMFETEASGERHTSAESSNLLAELEAQQESLELQMTHRLPDSPGVWFVDSVRTVYEREVIDEVRHERMRREEEEQKRLAAVAEDQESQDEEAEREEEAAEREEEERREIAARRAEQVRVEREAEQRRLELEAKRQEELRWARKLEDERRGQEKRALKERTRIRKDHRNHVPHRVAQANRDRVRQFLKVRGITSADLTPRSGEHSEGSSAGDVTKSDKERHRPHSADGDAAARSTRHQPRATHG